MNSNRTKDLFLNARDLSGDRQAAFLDENCGDDHQLRADVESLLAHDAADSEVDAEQTQASSSNPTGSPIGFDSGEMIDQYRIIRRIGSGGMGVVYLAEHTSLKCHVALKLMKPGIDTQTFIDRFRSERQTLAMMEHPGIASVRDAGTTATGQLWFAMDHVDGNTLTAYCDRHELDIPSRLALFIKICEAVQYAHEKLVVHRDLTPGNILVMTDIRDQPQPKIIDFGISKVLAGAASGQRDGVRGGTDPYMSPEQFNGWEQDIDTRTDVYALGVILYELVAGCTPFDRRELNRVGQTEAGRMLREIDPPSASERFSQLDEATQAEIARTRRLDPRRLKRLLERELDWIPLKAVSRRRQCRYSTPESIADDIRRYLNRDALEAAPCSRTYRFRKLISRNRAQATIAACFVLLVLTGVVLTSVFAARADIAYAQAELALEQAERSNHNATVALVKAENSRLELEAKKQEDRGRTKRVETLLATAVASMSKTVYEHANDFMPLDSALSSEIINNFWTQVTESNAEILDEDPELKHLVHKVFWTAQFHHAYFVGDHWSKAEPILQTALVNAKTHFGDHDEKTLVVMNDLGACLVNQGRRDEAKPWLRDVLTGMQTHLGDRHEETQSAYHNLGVLHFDLMEYDEAAPLLERGLELCLEIKGPQDPESFTSLNMMGHLRFKQQRLEEALAYFTRAYTGRQAHPALGPDHPATEGSRTNMEKVREMLLTQSRPPGEQSTDPARPTSDHNRIQSSAGNGSPAGPVPSTRIDGLPQLQDLRDTAEDPLLPGVI
ncbi:MAG: serine/threonine-protein kinase [Phycisphaerales bacterium]|nr:serine/threonine-protein kinase [Phycisphaerales bacterium]